MRISGFIIGGIVGAVAATYWSRGGRMPKKLSDVNWNQVIDKAGDVAQSAKNMWDGRNIFIPAQSKEEAEKATHH